MLICLISFSVLSLIVLIIGVIWTLAISGQMRTVSGPDVAAEIMAGQMDQDQEIEGIPIAQAQRTVFKGKGARVEGEVEFTPSEIKALVREGQWSLACPVLMAIGGMLALLLLGSCAIFFSVGGVIGLLFVVVAWYAVLRILIGFVRE
jgi:hypothetical protein